MVSGNFKKIQIALVCNIGFAADRHPFSIALLKQQLEASTNTCVDNYFLSSEFTYYIMRYFPHLVEINSDIGEIGSAYHDFYFSTKVFKHADPRQLIYKVLLNQYNETDICRTRLGEKNRFTTLPHGGRRYLQRIMEYCTVLDRFLLRYVENINWRKYSLIGFSCLSPQLMISLYTAKLIRQLKYNREIIFGGGMFKQWNVRQCRRLFSLVDDFAVGDGYSYIIEFLESINKNVKKCKKRMQIHYGDFSNMPDKVLKMDYFYVPVQLSGYCPWSRCLFCGVDAKKSHRVYPKEIVEWMCDFSMRNRVSRFGFVDPDLNGCISAFTEVVSLLATSDIKLSLHGMLNTKNLSKYLAKTIKQAGFTHVLLGVENFSNAILAKMNKRSDLVDNIKALKWLVEEKIPNIVFNVIIDFPGTNKLSIVENKAYLNRISHLLVKNVGIDLIEFDLERDSIAFQKHSSLGITELRNFEYDELVYPRDLKGVLKFHSIKYKWHRIADGWQDIEEFLRSDRKRRIVLQNKGERISIYHGNKIRKRYFFNEWQGQINRYICTEATTLPKIAQRVNISQKDIKSFLNSLQSQGLVIQHHGRYLGLALCES